MKYVDIRASTRTGVSAFELRKVIFSFFERVPATLLATYLDAYDYNTGVCMRVYVCVCVDALAGQACTSVRANPSDPLSTTTYYSLFLFLSREPLKKHAQEWHARDRDYETLRIRGLVSRSPRADHGSRVHTAAEDSGAPPPREASERGASSPSSLNRGSSPETATTSIDSGYSHSSWISWPASPSSASATAPTGGTPTVGPPSCGRFVFSACNEIVIRLEERYSNESPRSRAQTRPVVATNVTTMRHSVVSCYSPPPPSPRMILKTLLNISSTGRRCRCPSDAVFRTLLGPARTLRNLSRVAREVPSDLM